MNNTHKWQKTDVQGYQGLHCEKCHYTVVAYSDEGFAKEVGVGGSMHLPEHRMILVAQNQVVPAEAFKLTEVYGIECKVG